MTAYTQQLKKMYYRELKDANISSRLKKVIWRFTEDILKQQQKDIFSRLPTKHDPVTKDEILEIIEKERNG